MRYKIHGNGFLRIFINDSAMVHVYAPWIPRQKTYIGIHDHRFSFVSTVLFGTLENRMYSVWPAKSIACRAYTPDESDKLVPLDDNMYAISEYSRKRYSAGESYTINVSEVHDVSPVGDLVITLVTKFHNDPYYRPRVFVPEGIAIDNEFDNSEKRGGVGEWKCMCNGCVTDRSGGVSGQHVGP